jgi:hypothetical protein
MEVLGLDVKLVDGIAGLSLNTLIRALRLSINIDQSDQLNSVPVLGNEAAMCV